jgi:hypothetical protein
VVWEGLFDTFAYIDVDTVVLDSVDFAFEQTKQAHYLASTSNLDGLRRWVWKDDIYETHLLTKRQIAYSANTGFFVSVRGLLPMRHIFAKLNTALELKRNMVLHCMEQPFLNYLVVTSGYKYTSLWRLHMSGIVPDVKIEWWAGNGDATVSDGKLYSPTGVPVFLVHWAGIWHQAGELGHPVPYKELWNFYRRHDVAVDVVATYARSTLDHNDEPKVA